jgi:uncharacterized protein (DUF983 family)
MREACPHCGLILERGESSDFWIGAYVFNLVAGEVVAFGVPIAWAVAKWPNPPWTSIQIVAAVLAIGLPFLFFPFSRTLWLAWEFELSSVRARRRSRRTEILTRSSAM